VKVLREAINERGDACRAGEYRAPLLEGDVCGEHRGSLLVATTDDVVEQVG